jgi:hypothetical protein
MKPTDAGAHGHDELSPGAAELHPPSPEASAGLHNEGVAHEHSDVNVRAILMFAGGLVTVALIVQVTMWLLFGVFERTAVANDPVVSPLATPATVMPRTSADSPYFGGAAGPQLVTDEPKLLQMLHARETQELQTYGWIDQQGGVARVPIDEAKKLLLQRGLPARASDQADPHLGTHGPSLGESSSGRAIPVPETAPPTAPPGAPAEPGAAPAKPGGGV